jgi:zinc protease
MNANGRESSHHHHHQPTPHARRHHDPNRNRIRILAFIRVHLRLSFPRITPMNRAVTTMLALIATTFALLVGGDLTDAATPVPESVHVLQARPDRILAQLPNGLIVIVQQVKTAPVVSVQAWIKTGSIYEQEHVGAGLSHFLEHLLSGGTTSTRTEAQTNAILGQIGARTNASTSLDTVRYHIDTTAAHAPQAIDLLSDWMQHSLINQAEYERERDVIQREFEMGAGEPGRIYWKLTQQARYQYHPARHPTIGYLDEFLRISRAEIFDFYKRMYVPNNMVFVVAGDIDPRQTLDDVVSRWKDAPRGELPQLAFPVEPAVTDPTPVTGYADIARPRLRLAWPSTTIGAEGDYALDLLGGILGAGESARLTRTLRDEARLVNTIDAYNLSFTWGNGFFAIEAEIAPPESSPAPPSPESSSAGTTGEDLAARIDQVQAAILEQVQRIIQSGVTDAELARVKRQVLAQTLMANQEVEHIAARLARDVIGMADPDYLTRYAHAIQSITPGQVQQAAGQFLQRDRMIRVALLPKPKDEKLTEIVRPPAPSADAAVAAIPVDLDNAQLLARLTANLAAASAAVGPLQVDPVQTFTLDNGLRVLIQRSTVVPAVAMQMYRLGGLLADAPGREGVANAAAVMQLKGTQTRSAQQIAQAIEDLGAALSTQSGNNTVYAAGVALRDDYPAILELLADVTLHPTFPQDEWDKLRPRLLAGIARQNDSWSGELAQHFRATWFGGNHPWSQSTLGRAAVVENLTPDDLRAFHFDHLSAQDAVLAIYGDVDVEQAKALAARYFSALPAKPNIAFTPTPPPPPTAGFQLFQTVKPLAAAQIGLGPGLDRQSPDYPAMQVLARVVSDFPAGRLEQALRGEGPGLVYAVGAANVTGIVPGYFLIRFNTDPQRLPQALERTLQVIQQTRATPVSDADLARAKAKVLTDESFNKQTNADRAADDALALLYGLGLDDSERFLAQVAAMTPQRLLQVAQTHLHGGVAVLLSNTAIDLSNSAVNGLSESSPQPGAPAWP